MKKRLLMIFGCISLLLGDIPVSAQTTICQKDNIYTAENEELPSLIIEKNGTGENVGNTYDSILQVVVTYKTDEGEKIPLQGGSAFLIGDDQEQLQYLITAREVVSVSDEMQEILKEQYALGEAAELKISIEVVINKDVTVNANVVTESEEMNFAILQLEQSLYDRQQLLLDDKGIEEHLGKMASVIGYPSASCYGEGQIYYTVADLQKTEGFLETEKIMGGQKYVQHHIFPNYGNIGGPILDEHNYVLALNQSTNDGKNFYALEIQQIMSVCDSLGIPYKTVSMQAAETAEKIAAIVHKENLAKTIVQAEQIDVDAYKKVSVGTLIASLITAKKVNQSINATQEQVDEAQQELENAITLLVPKTPLHTIILFIAVIFFIMFLISFIVMKLTKKKRLARKEKKKADFTVTEPAPDFSSKQILREKSYKDFVQAGNKKVKNEIMWNQEQNEDTFEQTKVLGGEKEEALTGVLSQQSATLVREQGCERICVYKFPFVIGKDRERVDYCIQDNSAVSRVHATILLMETTYYIQDNHATNGTFVNGVKIESGGKAVLRDNDKVTLGNEEFCFKTVI